MGALQTIITASCVSLSGVAQDACNKALEAGTKQSGVEQNVNKIEDNVSKTADKQARSVVGNSGMDVAGGVAFIAKSVVEKSAIFALPTFGLNMSLKAQVGAEKSGLSLEWKY